MDVHPTKHVSIGIDPYPYGISRQKNGYQNKQKPLGNSTVSPEEDPVEALKTAQPTSGLRTDHRSSTAGSVPAWFRSDQVTKDGDLKPSKSGFKEQRCGFQHDLYHMIWHDSTWFNVILDVILVGGIYIPLWKIWVGQLDDDIPNIWKNKKCFKPPIRM